MAAKGEMEPKKLPPTDSAAIYHSYRVYSQVLVWDTLDQSCSNCPCRLCKIYIRNLGYLE